MEQYDSPNYVQCRCCGEEAVIPLQIHSNQEVTGEEHEVMLFKCLICSDNWISEKKTESDDGTRVSFHHHVDLRPELTREIRTENDVMLEVIDDEDWDYYVGGEEVNMEEWFDVLELRREEFKSSALN